MFYDFGMLLQLVKCSSCGVFCCTVLRQALLR